MDSVGIPRQLILTGPGSFLQDLPLEVQRNVEDIITANPTLNVQWFSDADCYSYISYYYDSELAGMFRREFRGSFRGDLCRAAVLYREGGFYVDLDFELLVPLTTLIGVSTTFLSVFAANGAILNALMASTPYSYSVWDGSFRSPVQYIYIQYIIFLYIVYINTNIYNQLLFGGCTSIMRVWQRPAITITYNDLKGSRGYY